MSEVTHFIEVCKATERNTKAYGITHCGTQFNSPPIPISKLQRQLMCTERLHRLSTIAVFHIKPKP